MRNVADFAFHRNPIVPARKRNAQKLRKRPRYFYHVVGLRAFGKPNYRVERIIQKMRRDLALQQFEFGFLQILLLLNVLFNQRFDSLHHRVQIFAKRGKFGNFGGRNARAQVAERNFCRQIFHRCNRLFYRRKHTQKPIHRKRNHHHNNRNLNER